MKSPRYYGKQNHNERELQNDWEKGMQNLKKGKKIHLKQVFIVRAHNIIKGHNILNDNTITCMFAWKSKWKEIACLRSSQDHNEMDFAYIFHSYLTPFGVRGFGYNFSDDLM